MILFLSIIKFFVSYLIESGKTEYIFNPIEVFGNQSNYLIGDLRVSKNDRFVAIPIEINDTEHSVVIVDAFRHRSEVIKVSMDMSIFHFNHVFIYIIYLSIYIHIYPHIFIYTFI